ncbi:MAG: hypothetical protein ACRDWE_09620 [Acidimicrobiales bacterium]
MSVHTNGRPITRADLEAAFQRVVGEGEKTAEAAVPAALVVAGAVAVAFAALVYFAGKHRGQKRSSVIEIRRL